ALAELLALLGPWETELARAAVVTGEAGIGKTRLLRAFADEAETRGWFDAWGRCHDDEGAPPLWPWSQSLRRLIERRPDVVGADACGDLAALLPQLGPITKAPDDADAARFRQFEAVTRLLERAAAAEPIVIVLEDLHWADTSSLRLLRFVAKYARSN